MCIWHAHFHAGCCFSFTRFMVWFQYVVAVNVLCMNTYRANQVEWFSLALIIWIMSCKLLKNCAKIQKLKKKFNICYISPIKHCKCGFQNIKGYALKTVNEWWVKCSAISCKDSGNNFKRVEKKSFLIEIKILHKQTKNIFSFIIYGTFHFYCNCFYENKVIRQVNIHLN